MHGIKYIHELLQNSFMFRHRDAVIREQQNFLIFALRIFGELSACWRYGGDLLARNICVVSVKGRKQF
jgi:hypothetical protein